MHDSQGIINFVPSEMNYMCVEQDLGTQVRMYKGDMKYLSLRSVLSNQRPPLIPRE